MDDFDESKMFSAHATKKLSKLSQYYVYRLPGLHTVVPTKGRFLKDAETSMNGEFVISPMRAQDDMLLKNPDALMSGLALEKLFESCVPGISNPREISMPDIDVLLIAIRAATYGDIMKLDVKCPECESEYDYDCHLPGLLGTMTYVDEDEIVHCNNEVAVHVRPYNLNNASQIAFSAFEESRMLQNLDQNTAQDEEGRKLRYEKMTESLQKLKDVEARVVADCVTKVVVPDGEVSDKQEILDFIENTSKSWKEMIEKRVSEMNNHGIDKSIHIQCTNCSHEWDTQMEIDPTSFFAASS